MVDPWIEKYRGEWENAEGFRLEITPTDAVNALVDITHLGSPILRPWCGNTPTTNLNAIYREKDGLGVAIYLGRDGFEYYLDYEPAGFHFDREYLSAGISRLEDDREADQWTDLFSLDYYFRLS